MNKWVKFWASFFLSLVLFGFLMEYWDGVTPDTPRKPMVWYQFASTILILFVLQAGFMGFYLCLFNAIEKLLEKP